MLYEFRRNRARQKEDREDQRSIKEHAIAREAGAAITATLTVLHNQRTSPRVFKEENVIDIIPKLDPRTDDIAAQATIESIGSQQPTHVKVIAALHSTAPSAANVH